MLAAEQRFFHVGIMKMIGQPDVDSIDLRIHQHFAVIRISLSNTVFLLQIKNFILAACSGTDTLQRDARDLMDKIQQIPYDHSGSGDSQFHLSCTPLCLFQGFA
ncbi:hypothetical protein D3C75_980940 [compost metagenome]